MTASPFESSSEQARRPIRVLVVEDEEDIRAGLCDLLVLRGYDVLTARDGREALEQLRSSARPDVILLDLMMPVMTGAEFRRAQLADAAVADIPVVVLTASDPAREGVRRLGVSAAFGKPFDTGAVFAAVERLAVRGRRARADAPGPAVRADVPLRPRP